MDSDDKVMLIVFGMFIFLIIAVLGGGLFGDYIRTVHGCLPTP
jgi:hypothetical protein